MNLERFHTIIATAHADADASGVSAILEQLVGHLENQVNDPGNPEHQKNVSKSRIELTGAIDHSASNDYPPSWWYVLARYGVPLLLAEELRERTTSPFFGNDLTPQSALEKLKEASDELKADLEAIGEILKNFGYLSVGTDELEPGECEITITVPRSYLESGAAALGKEFNNLEKLLRPFSELATGELQIFEVRAISSSDFTIVFGLLGGGVGAALTVKTVADAVRSVISVYKEVLEVRLMKAKLNELKVDREAAKVSVASLEDLVKKTITKGMKKNADRICKENNQIKNRGRANEVRNHIRANMIELARRIDHGFEIETRMGALPEPQESEGEGPEKVQEDAEMVKKRGAFEVIDGAHKEQMQFSREGVPILSLPNPANDDKEEDEAE